MLRSLKSLFAALQAETPSAGGVEHTVQLASAVMLIEVMRADAAFDASERRIVIEVLRDHFALDDGELEALIDLATDTSQQATDLFAFTTFINANFDMPNKIRMIEAMWRVAYADARLDDRERHVIWRIADLLHVPQGAYVNARLRAAPNADD